MNKITLKTSLLKDALAKAVKGNSKVGATTADGLIVYAVNILAEGEKLTLTTTNNNRNLTVTVKLPKAVSGKFFTCTESELFYKLISRQTVENITIEVKDKSLLIQGNGIYNLPIVLDDDGSVAEIPPIDVFEGTTHVLAHSDINKIISYNKASIAKSFEIPIFTNYFVDGDVVASYNNRTLCVSNLQKELPKILLTQDIVDLFDLFTAKEIKITIPEKKLDKIQISDGTVTIDAKLPTGAETYPGEDIINVANDSEFKNTIKISKQDLKDTISRMELLLESAEQEFFALHMKNEGVIFDSMNNQFIEQVNYTEKDFADETTLKICVRDIKSVLDTITEDTVVIKFGAESGILVLENNTKQIIPFYIESKV